MGGKGIVEGAGSLSWWCEVLVRSKGAWEAGVGGVGEWGAAGLAALRHMRPSPPPLPLTGFLGKLCPFLGGRCGGSWVGGRLYARRRGLPPSGCRRRRTTALAAAGVPSLDTN